MFRIFRIILIISFLFSNCYGATIPEPSKDDKSSIGTQQYLKTIYEELKRDNASLVSGGLALKTGTIPSSSPADETQLYSEEVATFSATGGTITTDGDYTVHTFTSSGTFTATGSINVIVLVVAGGGGGGGSNVGYGAGGGGAGGLVYHAAKAVTTGDYTVTIGAGGGEGASGKNNGTVGNDSVFGDMTALGGGYGGGAGDVGAVNNGGNGGSGGGAGADDLQNGTGGSATQGDSGGGTGFGYAGGTSTYTIGYGGAGGGAGAVGGNGTQAWTDGGAGKSYSISGSAVTYATGGGSNTTPAAGTANRGDGGDGCLQAGAGAAGGSGIVIVRYTPTTTSAELRVRDEAGNVTTLSPHNFSGIPPEIVAQTLKNSSDLAWTYHSEKDGKQITVDIFNAIKDLEAITGKKYIYITEIKPSPILTFSKYFAEIKDNIVQRVIVANDKEWCEKNIGGIWVETFINNPQKNYAGKGYTYYPDKDNFSPLQPYPSWQLDNKCNWQPPIEMPKDGKNYSWDEEQLKWVETQGGQDGAIR